MCEFSFFVLSCMWFKWEHLSLAKLALMTPLAWAQLLSLVLHFYLLSKSEKPTLVLKKNVAFFALYFERVPQGIITIISTNNEFHPHLALLFGPAAPAKTRPACQASDDGVFQSVEGNHRDINKSTLGREVCRRSMNREILHCHVAAWWGRMEEDNELSECRLSTLFFTAAAHHLLSCLSWPGLPG